MVYSQNKYDYTRDFAEWHESDMASMVAKDYNHPCVIMYSIGNEVSETAQLKGIELTKQMTAFIHSLDDTRPVTAGINLMLDLMVSKGIGIYKEEKEQPKKTKKQVKPKPQKENVSGSAFYNLAINQVGKVMNKLGNLNTCDKVTSPAFDALDIAGYNYGSGRYKNERKKHPSRILVGSETFPADIAQNWKLVKELPYLIGDFMWT